MANKRITDLTLISELTDTCNIPVDDTLQTYRATALQFLNYVNGKKILVAKNTDYTITDSDGVAQILGTTSSTDKTMTLPESTNNAGREIWFKKVDNGTGHLIIGAYGAELIDGVASYTLYMQYDAIKMVCDGTAWYITDKTLVVNGTVLSDTGAGHASTDDKIRIISNNITTGSSITVATNSANGNRYTINQAGIYCIAFFDGRASGTPVVGISKNSNQLTTVINSITVANRLASGVGPSNDWGGVTVSVPLAVGDVIRPHTNGINNNTTSIVQFNITQIARF